ncbi:MAG: glycosyl transferase group 1 [Candidatus Acidoferrum typicum]|nr:glycosyl transferase group 1 [Candidatus Acidoferrum typicum]
MTSRQALIVYRDELLGASETFVLGQAESLSSFQPFYVGLRGRSGLSLPESRFHIVGRDGLIGKLQRARFKLLGPNPSLVSMLAEKRPALIHAHFGPDGCNAIALAHALRVPLVVTLHGYDVTVDDGHLPRLYIQRRSLLKSHAAKFICVSDFIRKQAIEKGFPVEKTLVHYTGVDLDTFHVRPMDSRSPAVLFVGRLVPKKGCEYLIRAMARVQAVIPGAQLIVIGDGPLRSQLELQAAAALNNYEFLGEQEPVTVRDWMNRATVLGAPSVVAESGDAEGFGMIFAEAQAMGLPVASFASGGIPEAVADGQSGFLVPERDDQALAAKLVLLLGDRVLWTKMSEHGRARAIRLFNIRTQTAILENIYESVLSEWNGKTHVQTYSDRTVVIAQTIKSLCTFAQSRSL